MKWYNYSVENFNECSDIDIVKNVTELLINDENLKPDWVEAPAPWTEFHIKKNSESLLIVIGESWTYGESLPKIATAIRQYDFHSQLKHCFGPKIAVMLNSDYYQYAVPGNCNFYMFQELDRILSYIKKFNYKKIYLCMQMTEPAREKSVFKKLNSHPLRSLYLSNISFIEWLVKYDEIFFLQYKQTLEKHMDLNIDPILWKNFCKINYTANDLNFKVIDTSWIEYSSKIQGVLLDSPMFYSVDWVAKMYEDHKNINYDKNFILQEVDKIEKCNAFLKGNSLHSHHPNEKAHLLWSQFLARKSGWIDGI